MSPSDEKVLVELFSDIDGTFFTPHPFTPAEAHRIANFDGRDIYCILVEGDRAVAYGMLRGWDEGYETPSLGIAVRTDSQGRGLGRLIMAYLHHQVRVHGAGQVRLRVHPDNLRARQLYESLAYEYQGEERGELVMTRSIGWHRALPSEATVHGSGRTNAGVRIFRPDDPAWDDLLRDVPRDIYHTAAYHVYAKESGEGEPYLAVVGDRRRGVAWPYLLRDVSKVPGLAGSDATDVTSVYGYSGMVAWGCEPGDSFLDEAWALLQDLWRQQRVVTVFTRFHPLLGNAALAAGFIASSGGGHASPGVVGCGSTVSVDLTLAADAVRTGYRRGLRREIDSSRHAGLVTVHDGSWADLATFTRLYRETMLRAGAADYYFFGELDFRRLHVALGDHVHLLVTRLEDTVASAGLFFEFDGIVEWYLAGSDDAFRTLSPSKVLVDDAIRWAGERGNRLLHMGGGRGGHDDSLLWFKGRFSPRRHQFYTGRWILDPAAHAELVTARSAARAVGATVDQEYFPAYRAPVLDVPGADEDRTAMESA